MLFDTVMNIKTQLSFPGCSYFKHVTHTIVEHDNWKLTSGFVWNLCCALFSCGWNLYPTTLINHTHEYFRFPEFCDSLLNYVAWGWSWRPLMQFVSEVGFTRPSESLKYGKSCYLGKVTMREQELISLWFYQVLTI
jgi:hypothetical protein